MANLVTPGYKRSTLINRVLPHVPDRIIEFQGLNRKTVIAEGEMSDMRNMTADNYPVLSPRKLRARLVLPNGVRRPLQFIRRYEKIGLIAIDDFGDVGFYFDGVKVTAVNDLDTTSWAVAINTKLCFFPQKKYLEIKQTSQGITTGAYESLEASLDVSNLAVTMTVDSVKITLPSGHGFGYDDAINITGNLGFTPRGGTATSAECNVSCIIEDVINDNTLVLPNETFIELTGQGASNIKLTGKIERTMPDLDMIVEWNNRLWGCSIPENTIYACKLGDPKNWQYFQGTSLDSYYAQQGTDEAFTAVAEYSGHIIFFKPNSMCRIYGTSPSNYQITNTKCYGVEDGSRKSVLTINDAVFYKSAIGIMAYNGGVPYCISEKLNRRFKNVVAGTEGTKYYASVMERDGESYRGSLMVFDISKGMWHKEDDLYFTDTCTIDNKLYYTTSTDVLVCDIDVFCAKDLMCTSETVIGDAGVINAEEPTETYDDFDWMAVLGPFDEYIEEHKIYSKLALRIISRDLEDTYLCNEDSERILTEEGEELEIERYLNVYISLDEGDWELVNSYRPPITQGEYIPIIPRRCDRYAVKLEGRGHYEIKSVTRRVRQGTFGRL